MKKLLLISGALLAFTASAASAQQIHLAFTDCGSFGAAALNNPCITNSGSIALIGSVIPPTVPLFDAMEGIVDAAQAGVVSDWWRGDAAGCRNGALSGVFNFGALAGNCSDPFAGQALGSLFVIYPGTGSTLIPANSERFDIYCAIGTTIAIDATAEWYMFEIQILRSKSVGMGACTGCNTPMAFYFNDLVLGQPAGSPGGNPDLGGNGSGQGCGYNGGNSPTPTESKSWGAIKALYR